MRATAPTATVMVTSTVMSTASLTRAALYLEQTAIISPSALYSDAPVQTWNVLESKEGWALVKLACLGASIARTHVVSTVNSIAVPWFPTSFSPPTVTCPESRPFVVRTLWPRPSTSTGTDAGAHG